ncbi:MAG: UDP-N-acetylglucosamine diphosphorylase/glucosamine-1-phosphate N-acetyltransferase [Limisphaerales bacterium]|jgi:UDP-N-acetylglucosamine diphosphorylase/glucosamine-1-phosphate N-acetyltransferase
MTSAPTWKTQIDQLVFFDDEGQAHLSPFTYTRPSALIRCGILTLAEKWIKRISSKNIGYKTEKHLSPKFGYQTASSDTLWINGRALATDQLASTCLSLNPGESLISTEGALIAVRSEASSPPAQTKDYKTAKASFLTRCWDIFLQNGAQIQADFELLTKDAQSATLDQSNRVHGKYPVFLAPGAKASHSIFNTNDGPIYLDKDAEIMEGCLVRGPFSLGEKGVLKMGAKIYGGSTIGPGSKVGGEVNNSVLFGNSNKAHDGYLGNAVLGEWCNLGADTNNSNLKNNYSEVRVWNYALQDYENTGLQFCGLFMGDHSKAGINTMFNTGTVVGVSSNVFGSGFPRKFIPSFAWGGADGLQPFNKEKALELAKAVMQRRGLTLDSDSIKILESAMHADSGHFNRL